MDLTLMIEMRKTGEDNPSQEMNPMLDQEQMLNLELNFMKIQMESKIIQFMDGVDGTIQLKKPLGI